MTRKVLLLQGPPGPFFATLAKQLRSWGAEVWKINFNGGDWLFFPTQGAVNYQGHPSFWESFLREFISLHGITTIVCYGDCRWHHKTAGAVAEELGIEFWVCEEGYLRPDHITLEPYGVNANSRLPRDWDSIEASRHLETQEKKVLVGSTIVQRHIYFILHDLAAFLLRKLFPHYRHHRPIHPRNFVQGFISAGRWLKGVLTQQGLYRALVGRFDKQFYLVPLQVHFDCQLSDHSDFSSMEEFISQVASSFARHAPANTKLVFKHHPVDRGQVCYRRFIRDLSLSLGIETRVHYVHDLHLPSLLKAARGVVTINSTVGLSAIHHGTPTKTLGRALYALSGLVSPASLDTFWRTLDPVDEEGVRLLKHHLLLHTQLNGNFFKHIPWTAAQCAEQILDMPASSAATDLLPMASATAS